MSRPDRFSWFAAQRHRRRRSKSSSVTSDCGTTLNRRLRVELLEDRRLLAVITVDSLFDNTTNDGLITLREAIIAANADSVADATEGTQAGSGADSIDFDASLDGGTILLTSGELGITEAVTIDAASLAGGLTIDAQENSRIFNITATTDDFTIAGLTLTGGRTTGNNTSYYDSTYSGGAIRSLTSGDVTITNSVISNNSTEGDRAYGGGVFFTKTGLPGGHLILIDTTVSGNSTLGFNAHGGGIDALRATLTNSTVSGNSTSGFGDGGGISGSTVTLTGSTVSGNSVVGGDGGKGGGIFISGTVTLTDSTVSGNSISGTSVGGGGIWANSNVTLTRSTVSGNSASGIFGDGGGILAQLGDVTINQSTISGNSSSFRGGGIKTFLGNVTINQSTISGNSSSYRGGGIWNGDETVRITDSIVAGNTASGGNPDIRPGASGLFINYSLIGDSADTYLSEAPTPDANGSLIGGPVNGLIDPLLGPLANNGGPTQTHALLSDSPAIDAGDPSITQNPTEFDQRGNPFLRVLNGDSVGSTRIDMGAFEITDITEPTVTIVRANSNPTNATSVVFDVNFSEEVLGVDASDFVLKLTGTLTGNSSVTVGDGGDADLSTYAVIVDAITGDGTLGLDFSGGTDIQDTAGNNLITTPTTDEVYTVDNTAPVVMVDFLITNDTTPQLTGTVDDPNATITVDVDGQTGLVAVNNSDGTWTLPDNTISSPLALGTYDVAVTATDIVTNTATDATVDELVVQFRVDILDDESDGDFSVGDFSLREAIGLANDNVSTAETITFSAGLDGGTILLTLGELGIADALTIDATSLASGLTIDAGDGTDNVFGTGDGYRIFNIDDGSGNLIDVQISGLMLTGGDGVSNGGAIFNRENLTVSGSTISGNAAASKGGGIHNNGPVTVNITSSTISDNSAYTGGGIYSDGDTLNLTSSTISGNSAFGYGGGIYSDGDTLNLTSSTISGNSADHGGGIYSNGGTQNITNSTIGGNSANEGGGIYRRGGTLNITNSTISSNLASSIGGGIHSSGIYYGMILDNTIIAGNSASSGNDIWDTGGVVSGTFNLIGDGTGQTGIVNGTDGNQVGTSGSPIIPLLGSLADNGGPTETHALMPGSPAIDAGDPAFSGLPDFDQRGVPFTRTYDGDGVGGVRIDIGAVEVQPAGGGAIAAFDADPQINGSDFLSWQKGLGINGGASQADGDATFDGEVTSGDLEVWELQFGTTAAPLAAVSTPISAQSFSTASTPTGLALNTSLASGDLVDVALAVALAEGANGAFGKQEFVDHTSPLEYFSAEPIGQNGSRSASSISSPTNTGATSAEESESPEPPVRWEDALDEVFASIFE